MERQVTDRIAGNATTSTVEADAIPVNDQTGGEIPEDVAILYSWANLQGARYRDFSASRREYRAQMRRRAAETLHEQELKAVAEAALAGDAPGEASVPQGDRAISEVPASRIRPSARTASPETRHRPSVTESRGDSGDGVPGQTTDPYLPHALPEGEYFERPGTPAAKLSPGRILQQREYIERATGSEIPWDRPLSAEVRSAGIQAESRQRARGFSPDEPSGQRRIVGDDPAGLRRRNGAAGVASGDAPLPPSPGSQAVPSMTYEEYQRSSHEALRRPRVDASFPDASPHDLGPQDEHLHLQSGGFERAASADARPAYRQQQGNGAGAASQYANPLPVAPAPLPSASARTVAPTSGFSQLGAQTQFHDPLGTPGSQRSAGGVQGPAWLYPPAEVSRFQPPAQPVSAAAEDTLQHSRERVAARWFALKGVFQQPGLDIASDLHPQRRDEVHAPILAVFSLAGGVGKTSLVATLGRALSALGEQVLLADTTSHGLLPYYFGASELISGVVRNFSPPPGSKDAHIHLVGYDVDRRGEIQTREDRRNEDSGAQDKLAADLLRDGQGKDRVLLDLPATSSWVVRRVARMNPTVLIPLAPDMNSVITLKSLNQFLQSIQDADGHPLSPYFILNQFDPSLPLHIDVREVLRQQLGERLLPFVIHRAPAISEALAEGMTILDYAPESVAAQDYLNVATWIRSVAASTSAGFRKVRWSER